MCEPISDSGMTTPQHGSLGLRCAASRPRGPHRPFPIAVRVCGVQLFFLLISRGTMEGCVHPSDAVRVELEAAFVSGCVVVPVHWFAAKTTEDSATPTWVHQRPPGVSAADHKSAMRMWQRLYSSQGTASTTATHAHRREQCLT